MKKTSKIKTFVICTMLLGFCSCQHEIMLENAGDNRVIPIQKDEKSRAEYLFVLALGHNGKNCPGCILSDGKWIHVDCQGAGNACATSALFSLSQTDTNITATTTDTFGLTNLNFILMPPRSLNYTDGNNNRIFLNIPGQFLFRDTTTQQFTFTGLFFSNTAAYSNN